VKMRIVIDREALRVQRGVEFLANTVGDGHAISH
jgi:hypothetical protein